VSKRFFLLTGNAIELSDKNLRKSAGDAAKCYVTENFKQERIIEKIKSVYKRLLERV